MAKAISISLLLLLIILEISVKISIGFQHLRKWGQGSSFKKASFSYLPVASLADDRYIDLTSDRGVLKKVIQIGQGRSIEAGDIVAVAYTASVKGSSKPFAKGEKEQFIVKDGSMIKGIDVAISSMVVGERASFSCSPKFAYGNKGVGSIIPPDAELELDFKILAWLGNQLRPESLFQKDLDIDPFIASTPESIQKEYDDMQFKKADKYKGNIVEIYLRRLRSTSFGFGGSGFFTSQR